jgi:hypothetical protein
MAAVFAQVGGDAICARHLGQKGGAQWIGPSAAARVAHGGDVVNIHAKAQFSKVFHGFHLTSITIS